LSKSDYFDRKIKNLFTQKVKSYLFDIIYFFNIFAKPFHYLKRVNNIYDNRIINMGCGATYIKGWINVDGNPLRKKDLWLDVRCKWPFRAGTIKGIVASHLIEHLYDDELSIFFSQLKRAIKKDGFVHLEVPSLEILIENYRKNNNGVMFNEVCFWHGAHRQVFDFGRLEQLLSNAGLEVKFHIFGEKKSHFLNTAEVDEICLRPEQSIIVEAVKL